MHDLADWKFNSRGRNMQGRIQSIAVSLVVIALGVAWLLNTMNIIPGVNWVWTGGLGLAGLLILALGGLNRLTVVTGPFLIVASVLSVLRQTGVMSIDHEVPAMVIVLGVLMLIAQISPLPNPGWMDATGDPRQPRK
jgi:hypothetical protein